MEAVLLRTLTLKSKLWFGRYNNLTVQEVINLGKLDYLRYVYYSIAGVSFNDEVLTKINILGESWNDKIEKPGTNLELFYEIEQINFEAMARRFGENSANKTINFIRKQNYGHFYRTDKIKFKKSALQAKNHGH